MALLESLEKPMLSVSFILPGESLPVSDPESLDEHIINQLDEIVDSGACGIEATTVIDLTAGVPELIRQGKGESELFR